MVYIWLENKSTAIIHLAHIQQIAHSVGFDACGVCSADSLVDNETPLNHWLQQGMHGEMGYMVRNLDKRLDPRELVPGAKSIISVLLNYYPGNPEISTKPPKISRYALSIDYHKVIKEMLWGMVDLMRKEFGTINGRAFVDSAPVLERAWAARAGLGWIGKNSMLINPKIGSYTFIGELIVDIDIEPSASTIPNRCGTCTRCIDACPTGAIVSPGIIDARKCISYLTIEKETPLTEKEKSLLNGWCFGCDICQEVCPWNVKVNATRVKAIQPKLEIININLKQVSAMSENQFAELFGDTPVARCDYSKFKNHLQ